MRKKENFSKKDARSLSPATLFAYVCGMIVIGIPLFVLAAEITAHASLTVRQIKEYALMLEHVLAGLVLLTAGCYLIERIARAAREN